MYLYDCRHPRPRFIGVALFCSFKSYALFAIARKTAATWFSSNWVDRIPGYQADKNKALRSREFSFAASLGSLVTVGWKTRPATPMSPGPTTKTQTEAAKVNSLFLRAVFFSA